MTAKRMTGGRPRLEPVIAELQQQVTARSPEVRFEVFDGDDPRGTGLRVIVDVENTDEVVDHVTDRLLGLQVDERLPLCSVASRPSERHPEQPGSGVQTTPGAFGHASLPCRPVTIVSPIPQRTSGA